MSSMLDLTKAPSRPSVSFEAYSDLLTVKDCSEIIQQSEATVRRLCREGELPSVRIGRRLYIPRNQFAEHIDALLVGSVA